MGGEGSGIWKRWTPPRPIVEQCSVLDVGQVLRPPYETATRAEIRTMLNRFAPALSHKTRPAPPGLIRSLTRDSVGVPVVRLQFARAGGAGVTVQLISLQATPAHLGGQRWWLTCPGEECGRRVSKLYLPRWQGTQFLCRQCHGLSYRSSQHAHEEERLAVRLSRMTGCSRDDARAFIAHPPPEAVAEARRFFKGLDGRLPTFPDTTSVAASAPSTGDPALGIQEALEGIRAHPYLARQFGLKG